LRVRSRKLLLFGGLAGIVGIVGLLLLDKPAKTPEVAIAKTDGAPARTGTAEPLKLPERERLAGTRGGLFGAPPPPPRPAAPAPAAAPVPVAPPVPYRFAGKVLKGSEVEVLISKGEFVFPVKAGDTLDGLYKVQSIVSDRIELVYLPLGTPESIAVSSNLEADRAPAQVAAVPPQPDPAPAADARPAQLRWEGPARVQAGTTFTVALRVSTKEPLRAAPMQIRFEPDVLEPVIVRPGKFFGDGNFSYRVNPAGSIFVGATSRPVAPGTDAELVIVTLRPIKRGATAELSMSALSLQGVAGRAIAHDNVGVYRATIQ